MMKRVFAGLSDQGIVRTANQDTFAIDKVAGRFFIVADGMGGHAGGQEASRIATQAIQTYLEQHWQEQTDTGLLLQEAFIKANQAILQEQQLHPEQADMGTTAVVVIFPEEGQPWCAHVGDSRLYQFRDAQLRQVTSDHTWIAEAVEFGKITAEQGRVHPWRHVLAQCLGREDLTRIDVQSLEVQPGDRLLLCSDGLTEELSDALITSYLESISVCEDATASLVDAAKAQGGRDNITVVLIAIDELAN